MCAALLTKETLRLTNVPMLRDVKTTHKLLEGMGATVSTDGVSVFDINCGTLNELCAPYDLVKTMRASILVLGPTLAHFGEAQVSLPGGCAIGSRPVDQHLKGLEAMGADIVIEHGYVKAKLKAERERMLAQLQQIAAIQAFESEANFITVRVPDADQFFDTLKQNKILIKKLHGAHPLLAQCVRITVGAPEQNDAVLALMRALYEK